MKPCTLSTHANCNHETDQGTEYTLFHQIDKLNIRCLNEAIQGAAVSVFKEWDNRFDQLLCLESDIDDQLLIHIPFVSTIKLKSISIIAGPAYQSPSKMVAIVNNQDVDFDTVDQTPFTQEWEMPDISLVDAVEYQCKVAKFSNVCFINLALFFNSLFSIKLWCREYSH